MATIQARLKSRTKLHRATTDAVIAAAGAEAKAVLVAARLSQALLSLLQ